jgi:hypothetical protein
MFAKDTAGTFEPGDEVMIGARRTDRSAMNPRTKETAGGFVVSTWMVTKAVS